MYDAGGDELAAVHHLLRAIDAGDRVASRECLALLLIAAGRFRAALEVGQAGRPSGLVRTAARVESPAEGIPMATPAEPPAVVLGLPRQWDAYNAGHYAVSGCVLVTDAGVLMSHDLLPRRVVDVEVPPRRPSLWDEAAIRATLDGLAVE